jgi:hypothetical protein
MGSSNDLGKLVGDMTTGIILVILATIVLVCVSRIAEGVRAMRRERRTITPPLSVQPPSAQPPSPQPPSPQPAQRGPAGPLWQNSRLFEVEFRRGRGSITGQVPPGVHDLEGGGHPNQHGDPAGGNQNGDDDTV